MKLSSHRTVIALAALFLFSCTSKPSTQSGIPLGYTDTVTLGPKIDGWYYKVEDPSRGWLKIELSNYTDTAKTFVIDVREIGE